MIHQLLSWLHTVFVQQLDLWVILGMIAQALFMMRFVIQWIASERVGKSIVPVAFWFFSIGGSSLLLTYSIVRQDPVFIAGQSLGIVIYFRNLWLIYKEKRSDPSF
ncbi:lipid-A-disaccharide synthase N-terminal domain-containing protein [Flexibacterium corallicola]|uniref:lipid-A-disaccharide synthase N-terminal domain-containing protein n=1 Tax=Flexibacterium corallicola TaxID=3037259 RepID=UPI00286EBA12|nr:lipid-A-disaccharide synthase N-terminal domain-containing protein [Pseudovibrio sp. M1P-2-3]